VHKVTCATIESFLENIGDNTQIILEPGIYDLSNIVMSGYSDNVFFRELQVREERELVLRKLNKFEIIGAGYDKTKIITSQYYADVFSFERCSNIHLEGIELGHYPDAAYCSGDVVSFLDCQDINICSVSMFGCGVRGLILADTHNLTFSNSVIEKCSDGITYMEHSTDVAINNCEFSKNESNDIILSHCDNIFFESCSIDIDSNISNVLKLRDSCGDNIKIID